ncbi:MAG: hypothetical protein KA717_02015 [Woronichinia naegeliana WA131]|jgi:hypothetical protein|uniref:Uncharacterized protein n=1 Tax=Woronichinia naegeliana WA131 TaxID=2824559 RepID=A0A977PX03_9CYAN|nr:MAG: hypothetical protein KA717_02015 [Woronichinia naegeliana WA131]
MKNFFRVLLCFLFVLILFHSQPAQADSKIKPCSPKSIPVVVKDDLRNIKAGLVAGRPYANASGMGSQLLPSLARNQEYREYDLDANNPNPANRGKFRAVALEYQERTGKTIREPIYLTLDHYKTFCIYKQ